jgi:hypothetical protein
MIVYTLFIKFWCFSWTKVYFGLKAVSEIPELVATIEDPRLPFTSISILKCYNETDMTYKIFSRQAMTDALLDSIFRYYFQFPSTV